MQKFRAESIETSLLNKHYLVCLLRWLISLDFKPKLTVRCVIAEKLFTWIPALILFDWWTSSYKKLLRAFNLQTYSLIFKGTSRELLHEKLNLLLILTRVSISYRIVLWNGTKSYAMWCWPPFFLNFSK